MDSNSFSWQNISTKQFIVEPRKPLVIAGSIPGAGLGLAMALLFDGASSSSPGLIEVVGVIFSSFAGYAIICFFASPIALLVIAAILRYGKVNDPYKLTLAGTFISAVCIFPVILLSVIILASVPMLCSILVPFIGAISSFLVFNRLNNTNNQRQNQTPQRNQATNESQESLPSFQPTPPASLLGLIRQPTVIMGFFAGLVMSGIIVWQAYAAGDLLNIFFYNSADSSYKVTASPTLTFLVAGSLLVRFFMIYVALALVAAPLLMLVSTVILRYAKLAKSNQTAIVAICLLTFFNFPISLLVGMAIAPTQAYWIILFVGAVLGATLFHFITKPTPITDPPLTSASKLPKLV